MQVLRFAASASALALALAVVATGPAHAAVPPYSGPCIVDWTSCDTGYLHAGPNGGITVEFNTKVGGGNFKLIDLHSGVVVWSKGLGNFQDYWKTITGLSSDYYCTVRNAGPGAGCAIFAY
ncbi:hypothetical protein [Actinomadura opuntiae]|uniref:hypothetical protein n=1 Tax=Actinomadura sp. OS1-43 TaxID=604315 RepID=UPI00255A8347|nr:hypothetical protein [Actinomadura sp. OS1-43]MDL4821082.1 hypothetical protein [Actinomadura sp. OS1-43]